jgi:predicted DNA-binding transcriptional regulator YafY
MGLQSHTTSAERKILAALAPAQRKNAGKLRDRFHVDVTAWYRAAEAPPHLALLAEAVLGNLVVEIDYRRWEAPREVRRRLAPYGLVLKGGAWYLVAAKGASVHTYRIAHIQRLRVTDEEFEGPATFELRAYWAEALNDFDAED